MARYRFGSTADYVISPGVDNVATLQPGVSVTCWNLPSGGTQYTDLTDTDGTTPLLTLTTNAQGAVPEFYGPDGIAALYLDANGGAGPRRRTMATSVGDNLATHEAATNPHNLGALTVGAVPSDGGTFTGPVAVDPHGAGAGYPLGLPSAVDALSIPSTFAGGEDDGTGTDTTGRINLYSYQRAQTGSFGETIRHFAMRKDSKQMAAWYFPDGGYDVNRDPVGTYKPVVWAGAHWEANNHASNHKHWSVETPDSTGAIQTRFEIRFGDPTNDTAIAGLDKTLIATNLADFVVRCTNGQVLRLSSALADGAEKAIEFNHDYAGAAEFGRWKIRATGEAETGSDAGTNFQIVRYNDAGIYQGAALHIQRSTGRVAIGGEINPQGLLHVSDSTGQLAYLDAQASNQSAILVNGVDGSTKALQTRITGDAQKRFQIMSSGALEWGNGVLDQDANLYRSADFTLKTDGNFTVGSALDHDGATAGFYGAAPVSQPVLNYSRTGETAAQAQLRTALATLGLVSDQTTA